MADPVLPSTITTEPSVGSVLNTINPISFLNTQKEYVPKSFINLFSSEPGSQWDKSGAPAKTAHILLKALSGAAVLGAGAWGLRSLMHNMKMDTLDGASTAATAG